MARAAVAGLTVGMAALAGLALWGTAGTASATNEIRKIDVVSSHWAQVSMLVDVEHDALEDYLRAGSEIGRQPLIAALGSAGPSLTWLQTAAGPEEAHRAVSVARTYQAYTQTLQELVAAGNRGDRARVQLFAEQAGLSASSLRKQCLTNTERKRQELNTYIAMVDQHNQRLRLAAEIIGVVDFLLLALCALALLNHQRRTERQAVESRHQALHDSLTGVANRTLLADRMERALATAARRGDLVGLLLLDLDRFKEINDTLGHHHGDLLLREVAERHPAGHPRPGHGGPARRGRVRGAAAGGRLGGVASCGWRSACSTCCAPRPISAGPSCTSARASVPPCTRRTATPRPQLLQHADIAMYAAKRGQLGTVVYDQQVDHDSFQQLSLFGELRQAIDGDELVLHYQPKIDASTGRCGGVEALVRWQHPKRGLLPPGEFIPLAERTELIRPLTDWVMRAAMRQHRAWRDGGLVLPIAVNVAANCLLDDAFPEQVAGLLEEYGMAPGLLTLEITESAMITDQTRAAGILERLHHLGTRLSIDDFGTGYSSMSHLQTMPLDELKIDRRFVATLDRSEKDAAIVRAILEMAHVLRVAVVAEGVEDRATWTSLRAMGCDAAQGYHFCRPLPVGELLAWLADQPGPPAAEVSTQPVGVTE